MIREHNAVTGNRKRVCGEMNTQFETGAVMGELLSQGEAAALMANPKFSKVAASITNNHMEGVAEAVGQNAILGTMDVAGIPHHAYNKLIQTMKNGVRKVNKHLNFNSMPTAFRVSEFHLSFLECNVRFAALLAIILESFFHLLETQS